MHIKVKLDISETFYLTGVIQFCDLNKGIHQWIMNNQYDIDKGNVMNQEPLDDILTIYTIEHTDNPIIHFHGYLKVPKNTSQTKKEHYLEAHVQSGILPLLYPFVRFDINIEVTLPQRYSAVGFKEKDKIFYHNAKDTIDMVFIIYRQVDLHIYQNDFITIYAQKYHDYHHLKQMSDIAKEIYIHYEQYFGKLDDKELHIVLNPRFDNGGYTRRGIVCLVDRIEGLDEDTYQHLAHEISHLWWYNSDMNVENNWLNKSFAQYSSLLLIKEKYGLDAYNKYIHKWKETAKDLPSLSKLNESTINQFDICYYIY